MELDQDACYRAMRARDARFDGRLFIAVKTTGIYCRPVCPARTPKRGNVVFYQTAVAAQSAGFRPCLRCRPETAPELGAWRGTSNTVSRALALIELGGLDNASVEKLADRVGIGDRQLRRLFQAHLGVSPISVAQTRRVLLAKQLIHETRLPMTEIATASGFGSIRRFNDAFQKVFARSPSSLRRRDAEDVSAAKSGEVTILLRYRPPYDWDAMLSFLAARSIAGVEVIQNDSYARTIEIGEYAGSVLIERAKGDALRATIRFPKLSSLPKIVARLRRVFDLAADPDVIGSQLREDPALESLVNARPGLRIAGAWDGLELAVRAVLGQQITITGARNLAAKIVATYGRALPSPGMAAGLTHIFPRAKVLANAPLWELGIPKARARTLSSLAAAVVANPQIFAARQSLDDAVAQLCQMSGIGEWTAQYIAMREMREPDAFPAADVGLLRAMTDAQGQRPTPQELIQRAEKWKPWRAYAAQHLWASLPAVEKKGADALARGPARRGAAPAGTPKRTSLSPPQSATLWTARNRPSGR